MTLTRTPLGRAEAARAVEALTAWALPDRSQHSLHPGDVGWHLRFEEDAVRSALALWSDTAGPVAVELFDAPVRRVSVAPRVEQDEDLASALTAALTQGRISGDWIEIGAESAVGVRLTAAGWKFAVERAHLVRRLDTPVAVPLPYTVVGEADAPDRVAVQFAAFAKSTFSLARWRQMRSSPAGALAVDVLVHAPGGRPAAAATGWFAGKGRCAVLEPVGTHPDVRRLGYGRAVTMATAEELRKRGASAVAVLPPLDLTPAVGVYRAAGFDLVAEEGAFQLP
ncbi:MAG: GNAT family N-acetyltransferase [Hamadaea sp.]|nr:GNAT family N-acetyltransferase [Hamadaea sp.]